MNQYKWYIKKFNELEVIEWHKILMLRAEVFVVEQNCVYQDPDQKDISATHLFCTDAENNVIATARILPEKISYDTPSIGRVVLKEILRGSGIADVLMSKAIEYAESVFESHTIKISAQKHLKSFYERHGFFSVGNEYLEDDIPHILMTKKRMI